MSIKSDIAAYEDASFTLKEADGLSLQVNEELQRLVQDAAEVLHAKEVQLLRYYLEWLASDVLEVPGLDEITPYRDQLQVLVHNILCIPDAMPEESYKPEAVQEAFEYARAIGERASKFVLIFAPIECKEVTDKIKLYKEEQRSSFGSFIKLYVLAMEAGNRILARDMHSFIAQHYGWA